MKMVKERAAATGSQVCSEDGQTWSTCFLQQQATAAGGSGGSGTDCSVLNGTGCDMPVAAGTGMEVEMYYVAYSIYGMFVPNFIAVSSFIFLQKFFFLRLVHYWHISKSQDSVLLLYTLFFPPFNRPHYGKCTRGVQEKLEKGKRNIYETRLTNHPSSIVINAYLTLISNALSSILSDSPSFLLSAGNSNTVFNLTSASAQVLPIDLALTNILTYSSSSSLGLSSSLAPTSPSPNTALIALLPFYRSELTYRFATGAGALERLLRERLEQLLVGIMENVQEFLALAGGGAFLVRDDRFGLRGVEGLVEVLEAGFGQ